MNSETEAIRDANDRFRRGDQSVPGRMLITQGIQGVLKETGSDTNDIAAGRFLSCEKDGSATQLFMKYQPLTLLPTPKTVSE